MRQSTAPSYPVSIFIAGDYDKAREVCRSYCNETGFCVTVTKTNYVYTGGEEEGVIIGLINYPRFPMTPDEMQDRAVTIADQLRVALGQESYSIQYPHRTVWHSWRKSDAPISQESDDAK